MAYRPIHAAEVPVLNPDRFPSLDLILPSLILRENNSGERQVKDLLRKKWLFLSPEEWVRQHVIHWLLHQTVYPASLLSLEKGLPGNNSGRTDVLGFNRAGKPMLLVECKAALVKIDNVTVLQALRYNASLGAVFIWLTNGRQHKVLELHPDCSLKTEHAILPAFHLMEETLRNWP